MPDSLTVFAPASIANVGPCYDLMGYALDHIGDFVSVKKIPRTRQSLVWGGVLGPRATDLVGIEPEDNVAWVVANHLLREFVQAKNLVFSIDLTLHKYLPVSSGLGSSAASGVASVKAIVELLELDLSERDLVRALELGEQHTCGTAHPDNVVPSFFGGFYFLCPRYDEDGTDGMVYQLRGCERLISVVLKQRNVSITTRDARERVRRYMQKQYLSPDIEPSELLEFAAMTAAKAADMVRSVLSGDLKRIGWIMSHNEHLEASRGPAIPKFDEIKRAALAAGAFGCSISGSGPSIVAVTDDMDSAQSIRDAMVAAMGEDAMWLISPFGAEGARVIDSIDSFVQRGAKWNTFMSA